MYSESPIFSIRNGKDYYLPTEIKKAKTKKKFYKDLIRESLIRESEQIYAAYLKEKSKNKENR